MAVLFALLAAGPAEASTLAVERTTGTDRAGEYATHTYALTGDAGTDAVDVSMRGQDLVFHDPGGIETTAPGCTNEGAATVVCAHGQATRVLQADLGAGDDRIRVDATFYAATISGGDGDDQLVALGTGGETMDGGPGADLLDPGPGGTDHLSYRTRTAGVSVNAGGDSAAGEPGEGDVIRPGFEFVATGSGSDRVVAAPGGTSIESGAGDDVLEGGPGYDRLETGDGADVARGAGGDDEIFGDDDFRTPGSDTLEGGPGADYVYGSAGPDVVDGGPGRDELMGGRGVDRLLARDGEPDRLSCEERLTDPRTPRSDRAEVDALDAVRWCGDVVRTPPRAELLFMREALPRRRGGGTVRALIACPGLSACRGTLTIRVFDEKLRRAGHARFSLPGGGRATIRIPFRLRGPERSRITGLSTLLRTRDEAGDVRRAELGVERRPAR